MVVDTQLNPKSALLNPSRLRWILMQPPAAPFRFPPEAKTSHTLPRSPRCSRLSRSEMLCLRCLRATRR
jgi:hypothetical protein